MDRVSKVANFYLSKQSMSPKKLQKILYYAYAWTLALLNDDEEHLNNRLFDSKFEAWVHGPVLPEVYVKYKDYGWNDIPEEELAQDNSFPKEVTDILEQVWDVYGGMSGNQLEAISHSEAPWGMARGDTPIYEASHNKISDVEIFKFYNWQANGK